MSGPYDYDQAAYIISAVLFALLLIVVAIAYCIARFRRSRPWTVRARISAFFRRLADRLDGERRGLPRVSQTPGPYLDETIEEIRRKAQEEFGPRETTCAELEQRVAALEAHPPLVVYR